MCDVCVTICVGEPEITYSYVWLANEQEEKKKM